METTIIAQENKTMTEKQLKYISDLTKVWQTIEGDDKLLVVVTEKKDKVSTKLASRIIKFLLNYNSFLRLVSKPSAISAQNEVTCQQFDDEEKKFIAEINEL